MSRIRPMLATVAVGLTAIFATAYGRAGNTSFLPIIMGVQPTATPIPATPTPEPTAVPPVSDAEFRGLWVTRFDWTNGQEPADPARIDTIVGKAAYAGFNAIYFQVRGTADAYYAPGLEPWAQRVSGDKLGMAPDPYWDPLAYFIEKAHANGIQLHAYINVYPTWDCGSVPDASVVPQPFYHQLAERYGTTQEGEINRQNGMQWLNDSAEPCIGSYQRASPGNFLTDDHLVAVGKDLAERYDIDGIHLDHIRYGSQRASCDPVSLCRYTENEEFCSTEPSCEITEDYQDFQRRQVNGTVRRFYTDVILEHTDLWFSAAVWPIHTDKWGWGGQEGYSDYYQDSKAWVQGQYIDSISPMIYSNPRTGCVNDGDNFWTRARWEALATDFQEERGGRFIVPGIGGKFCNFDDIAWRIYKARQLGAAGHAIFSYSTLDVQEYRDDLRNGPYSQPATVPNIPWH